jgi:hypothetical protein
MPAAAPNAAIIAARRARASGASDPVAGRCRPMGR